MRMLALTPMLQSADLDRTEGWYRDVLGLRTVGRSEGWMRMERDGVALMFMMHPDMGAPKATATQYIYVEDLDALWASLSGRTQVEWGPERMSYGMTEFAVRDPDGYLLSFGEPISASEPVEA